MLEQIKLFARNPLITLAAGGVIGGLTGAGTMYLIGRKKIQGKVEALEAAIDDVHNQQLELDFDAPAHIKEVQAAGEQAIQELRNLGARVTGDLSALRLGGTPDITVERVVQPTAEQLEELDVEVISYSFPGEAVGPIAKEDPAAVIHNIFDGDDTWDYEEERNNRHPGFPYIIHVDELGEMGYDGDHTTLTYYTVDDVLCDERERPILNHAEVVGEIKFGHGSRDPNICYIRNEKLQAEYEILCVEDAYESAVLGNDIEDAYERQDLRHSRQPLRFRDD